MTLTKSRKGSTWKSLAQVRLNTACVGILAAFTACVEDSDALLADDVRPISAEFFLSPNGGTSGGTVECSAGAILTGGGCALVNVPTPIPDVTVRWSGPYNRDSVAGESIVGWSCWMKSNHSEQLLMTVTALCIDPR